MGNEGGACVSARALAKTYQMLFGAERRNLTLFTSSVGEYMGTVMEKLRFVHEHTRKADALRRAETETVPEQIQTGDDIQGAAETVPEEIQPSDDIHYPVEEINPEDIPF